MNLKQERIKHERKLAIIEMIEECERCIENAKYFISELESNNSFMKEISLKNSEENIMRYENIRSYLLTRYNN